MSDSRLDGYTAFLDTGQYQSSALPQGGYAQDKVGCGGLMY